MYSLPWYGRKHVHTALQMLVVRHLRIHVISHLDCQHRMFCRGPGGRDVRDRIFCRFIVKVHSANGGVRHRGMTKENRLQLSGCDLVPWRRC